LDELLGDQRLERLFSSQGRDCALQLWTLRIRRGEEIENRILHGRLLPYNHSDDTWYATDDEKLASLGDQKVELLRVNLYLKSTRTAELLRLLASGKNIEQLSSELSLKLTPSLSNRIGNTALCAPLVFRPIAYLLNRDSRTKGPLSPHGSAGALSASLVQSNKVMLLSDTPETNEALTKFALGQLNDDTGLRFDLDDVSRLGDVELLVFPTLDDGERELLNVDWQKDGKTLVVRLDPGQLAPYRAFRVRLGVYNNRQLVYSSLRTVAAVIPNILECSFTLSPRLRVIADEAEVEIYGVSDEGESDELCCRWRIGYIRQVNLNIQVMGGPQKTFRFNWLENVVKSPDASQRLKEALTVNQNQTGSVSHVGGRQADPWVDANWSVESFLDRVNPPASEGRFFERLGDSNGLSRLELVEWFKNLILQHKNHQVIIFDPYFEDAGISMVVPNASHLADYIVFTSLPKPGRQGYRWYALVSRFRAWWQKLRSEDAVPRSRINNLLAACERSTALMKNVRLKVFAMKPGMLHDRYVLVIGRDETAVAGFHLSNSLQKATENFPLLITPIPSDVLLKVHEYTKELLREAFQTQSNSGANAPKINLLFESNQSPLKPVKRFEPLHFLDMSMAGNVLAGWTGDESLLKLSGTPLKKQMTEKGFLEDDTLLLQFSPGLTGCLNQTGGNFSNFGHDWLIIGEILANTTDSMGEIEELPSRTKFLNFLADYVQRAFSRRHSQEVDTPISHVAISYFQTPLRDLFASAVRLESFIHFVKYAALSWAEWYAVRLLWRHSPDALVTLAAYEVSLLPIGVNEGHAVKLSLLSQIASEVAIAGETQSDETQRTSLIENANGFLQWMGWNLIDDELAKPSGFQTLNAALSGADLDRKISVLGWLIQKHARDKGAALFNGLIQALHQALPSTLSTDQTRAIVDSLRGPVRKLSWSEPWLYRDVIEPLRANGHISADDLCQIWVDELCSYLEDEAQGLNQLFRRDAEGNITETAALLYARSGVAQQQESLRALQAALVPAKREIQKPLASTSNWNRWNSALVVSMWIYAFTKWAETSSVSPSGTNKLLSQLSDSARSLALARPVEEWRSYLGSGAGELASFIEEVGTL
jgi:hypothetical protein